MSELEARYVPLERRAEWLIQKGVRAWQEIQRLAMSEEEPFDSVTLLGQELWLPHHETEGARYRLTLRLGVHYPAASRAAAEELATRHFRELEAAFSDSQGTLSIAAEVRE
jgi:hypothetical protein